MVKALKLVQQHQIVLLCKPYVTCYTDIWYSRVDKQYSKLGNWHYSWSVFDFSLLVKVVVVCYVRYPSVNQRCLLGSPAQRLAALKAAIDEEMNSVGAALRNTFMNKIPTPEDISATCTQLAQRLILDEASRTECKLALVDLLDEALQGKSHTIQNLHFLSKIHKKSFQSNFWTKIGLIEECVNSRFLLSWIPQMLHFSYSKAVMLIMWCLPFFTFTRQMTGHDKMCIFEFLPDAQIKIQKNKFKHFRLIDDLKAIFFPFLLKVLSGFFAFNPRDQEFLVKHSCRGMTWRKSKQRTWVCFFFIWWLGRILFEPLSWILLPLQMWPFTSQMRIWFSTT